MANRVVDQTGRDFGQYLLLLCAAIRSTLRYKFKYIGAHAYE